MYTVKSHTHSDLMVRVDDAVNDIRLPFELEKGQHRY
jgi:hypothetical protein